MYQIYSIKGGKNRNVLINHFYFSVADTKLHKFHTHETSNAPEMVEIEANVPPHSGVSALVLGKKMSVEVPFKVNGVDGVFKAGLKVIENVVLVEKKPENDLK